jgi:hypothetical protein
LAAAFLAAIKTPHKNSLALNYLLKQNLLKSEKKVSLHDSYAKTATKQAILDMKGSGWFR